MMVKGNTCVKKLVLTGSVKKNFDLASHYAEM